MFTQCDNHRRTADAEVQDRIIAAKKQHRANAFEWAQRAQVNLIGGNTTVAANQFAKAVEEMEAGL